MRRLALALAAALLVGACGDEDGDETQPATQGDKAAARPAAKRRHAADPTAPAKGTAAAPPDVGKAAGGQVVLKAHADPSQRTGVDWSGDSTQVSDAAKDLRLAGGLFEARAIADLGESASLGEAPPNARAARPSVVAPALPGHVYLVRVGDPDRIVALRVTELTKSGDLTFDWSAACVAHVAAPQFRTDAMLLESVDLVLQARIGSQVGDRFRVTLEDPSKWMRVKASDKPLDFASPIDPNAEAVGFMKPGGIPAGQALLVEGVDIYATAPGDTVGHGEVRMRIGRDDVLQIRDFRMTGLQWFSGLGVAFSGHEVLLELGNSSAADVRIHGRLVPLAEATRFSRVPFVPSAHPPDVARAGGGPAGVRGFYLGDPRVTLQARCGHGRTVAATMIGPRTADDAEQISAKPLSVDEPVAADQPAVVYVEGGLVPRDKLFIVTRVDWHFAGGEETPRLDVMGVHVVGAGTEKPPPQGSWSGRIEVPPGGERTVLLELRKPGAADVLITGEFVAAPPKDR
jgi:hypothetical protein